jgi:alkylhydroperoxidase/carboxymuconolactone decarboxylase family protein YurZ
VTREEFIEATTRLAFYTGWSSAVTATGVAREHFEKNEAGSAREETTHEEH